MRQNLSEAFKKIYNNREEVNRRLEIMLEQWEKEDYEKIIKNAQKLELKTSR